MKSAAMEMAAQVEKLVTVHKNTKVDAQMLEQADVDAVILAIGSSPITINLEGMDKLWHVSAPEVLLSLIHIFWDCYGCACGFCAAHSRGN